VDKRALGEYLRRVPTGFGKVKNPATAEMVSNRIAQDLVGYVGSRVSSSMGFKDVLKKSGVVAGGTGKR